MVRLLAVSVAVAALNGPSSVLFRAGYDLCRAAPLSAIRAAGGQPYARGRFVNGSCVWERADLKAGATLSTHPLAPGLVVMRQLLAGTNGLRARRIRVEGAAQAVLASVPPGQSQTVMKYLLAAYPRGVVQVNMNAPASLPDGRLLAFLRVVTRS